MNGSDHTEDNTIAGICIRRGYAVKKKGEKNGKQPGVMIPRERVSIDRRFLGGKQQDNDTAIGGKRRGGFPARRMQRFSPWRKKGKAD